MKKLKIIILTFFFLSFLISCSTYGKLIEREKTEYGTIKYFVETDLNNYRKQKRLIAKVGNSAFYTFYPDDIVKHTKEAKALSYNIFYQEIPRDFDDPMYYQKLSELDSIVFSGSDRILDSLKWKNFKSWKGASAFRIEVNYYHGFPKHEKFRPY
ncbi:hypothetical protein ACG2LH_18145 [Zhouia sp. PK063]|uniref:hypothetical protein n=1 Tax=Zhouia sp. PK063 TaxID=3373602 RepID=UPI0037A01A99